MSRISDKNKEVIKQQMYDVLTNRYQSVFKISERVGRSWKLVNKLLEDMKDESDGKWKGLQKETLSNLICWKKKD